MSKVYIFFADGFEDIEGLTVVDLMRRAGVEIDTVSIKETREVTTSRGLPIRFSVKRTFQTRISWSYRGGCRVPGIWENMSR